MKQLLKENRKEKQINKQIKSTYKEGKLKIKKGRTEQIKKKRFKNIYKGIETLEKKELIFFYFHLSFFFYAYLSDFVTFDDAVSLGGESKKRNREVRKGKQQWARQS